MFKKLGVYNKTVIAVYLGIVSWGTAVVASAPKQITASEWIALAGIGSIVLGVNRVQNDPAPTRTTMTTGFLAKAVEMPAPPVAATETAPRPTLG